VNGARLVVVISLLLGQFWWAPNPLRTIQTAQNSTAPATLVWAPVA
jgi:hypothetical protein